MDPAKVLAVTEWLAPPNLKQLQHFLGFAHFYRRFIRNYSHLAAPLTSTSTLFHWTPETEAAFLELKRCFTSALVLTQPDPGLQFIVAVDTSDTGVDAVLSQHFPHLIRRSTHVRAFPERSHQAVMQPVRMLSMVQL